MRAHLLLLRREACSHEVNPSPQLGARRLIPRAFPLPACAPWRLAGFLLFKSGRNGRLPWRVYYGRGRRLPAWRAGLARRARSQARRAGPGRDGPGGIAGGPLGAARAACLPVPASCRWRHRNDRQPASRNGWQIPGSNFGNRI